MRCVNCSHEICIKKVPIFSDLKHQDLLQIIPLIRSTDYKKGELLLKQGDMTDSLVIINKGSTKAYTTTVDGREQILYLFTEGDFYGEQYLLKGRPAAYNVEALEPVSTCSLSKPQFQQLLSTYPEIALRIIYELGDRLFQLESTMQNMGARSADTRIAALLYQFAKKYGAKGQQGIFLHLPISREGMANYLGLARETMSRKLSQFENEGIIQSINQKTIMIKDLNALTTLGGIAQ